MAVEKYANFVFYFMLVWGNKTSALFVKSIFHLHNSNYPGKLKLWGDAPDTIAKENDFYLPVDCGVPLRL